MPQSEPRPDPFHDGSVGSYVARFFICMVLGVFTDLLVFAGSVFYIRTSRALWLLEFWYVWLAVPVVFGVVGIFAFDWIVGIYDSLRRSHENR